MRFREPWRKQEFLGSDMNKEDQKEMEAKAAALYCVTYRPLEQANNESMDRRYRDVKFISSPWVAQDILCNLARKNSLHRQQSNEEKVLKHDTGGKDVGYDSNPDNVSLASSSSSTSDPAFYWKS